MANSVLVQVRVEPELKREVEAILADNGLDLPTAIRMFMAKVRMVRGIPFDVRTYSPETLAAMADTVVADDWPTGLR